MTRHIPLFTYDTHTEKQTLYVNKNAIVAFSHFRDGQKDCLSLKLDYNQLAGHRLPPREYIVCQQDNPRAYHELFLSSNPDVLPHLNVQPRTTFD